MKDVFDASKAREIQIKKNIGWEKVSIILSNIEVCAIAGFGSCSNIFDGVDLNIIQRRKIGEYLESLGFYISEYFVDDGFVTWW